MNTRSSSSDVVSAFQKTLKLLMHILKSIKKWIGIILIDNAMRKILHWYDERHGKLTAPVSCGHSPSKENTSEVQKVLTELNKYKHQYSLLVKERNSVLEQLRQTNLTVDELKCKEKSLHRDIGLLNQRISDLVASNNSLLRRCLPEKDVPSCKYYAQGDAQGYTLRKISTTQSPEHIYELNTLPGNLFRCEFFPVATTNAKYLIENRAVTLLSCDIRSIAPNASSISVIAAGEAVFENNKWNVNKKAIIQLV